MTHDQHFNPSDLLIKQLGNTTITSPLCDTPEELGFKVHFVSDEERIFLDDRVGEYQGGDLSLQDFPSLELAGPREKIFFRPENTRAAIVTCGGLCPGLNDVIRGLVMSLHYRYGVDAIFGIPHGYLGFSGNSGYEIRKLASEDVTDIHRWGGTILGTSRGPQEVNVIVDKLQELGVNILFVIGGDGTLRGAREIVSLVDQRGLDISVVGLPKTIDNDIRYVDRSFGFETAFSEAVKSISSAHNEARGFPNGIGLVKLMGRFSGFIACHAALAMNDVNFVLIPEVPFKLEGKSGILPVLHERLKRRGHAVIVVAEGAGQDLFAAGERATDPSGNPRLKDIGPFLKEEINKYFRKNDFQVAVKYIDPSYMIRSVPATPQDSILCWRLAQNAAHAAMAGKTDLIIGQWHDRFVHVPMALPTSGRKQVDPKGDLWLSVLEATGQPAEFI